MRILRQFTIIVTILTLLSCARQTAPTGGPMDSIPPILVESNPKHEQINFKGNSIQLEFNELVELNNPKEQIIVTPTIGKDYEVTVKNTNVILSWKRPLQDSTTYTFNFREAVKDATERNPARNLRIAVSTGNYIDSLEMMGTVSDALLQTPPKETTVALQPYSDTFNILKHQPTYLTKTDKEGKFKLENLKPGTYIAYTFTDANRNLVVDSRTESFGFLRDSITLDSTLSKLKLNITKRDMRPLKLTSARPYNTYYNIRLSKNVELVKILAPSQASVTYAFGTDRSNILVYNTFNQDSVEIKLTAIDSVQHQFDTLLYAKFSKQKVTPEKFAIALQRPQLLADKGILTTNVTLTKPFASFNPDSAYYQVDSLTKINLSIEDLEINQVEKTVTIRKRIDPAYFKKTEPTTKKDTTNTPRLRKINALVFRKGAFISIEQDSSQVIEQKMNPLTLEELGEISLIVSAPPNKNKLVEIVNSKMEIVGKEQNKSNVTFKDLPPDTYLIRLIIDDNNNGRWDGGNYLKKQEPEKVIYYENEKNERQVKLKANFELGPLLITY